MPRALPTTTPRFQEARRILVAYGRAFRTKEALRAGIHPSTFYTMVTTGELERLGRGLYRLSGLPPMGAPDLVAASLAMPDAVVCLLSALAFHEITTQIPHEVQMARERQTYKWPTHVDYPPIRTFWFTGEAFTAGIETQVLDGSPVRIYCAEKTLADCFKYRNKLGLDVAVEALRLYRDHKPLRIDDLLRYARICRVQRVIRPYLEASF